MADWLIDGGRRDAAVRRVHRAARTLFAERGIERTTAEAVARRAGCSRATFYRLVGNRTALVEAVLTDAAAVVVARVEEATAGRSGADRVAEAILSAVAAVRADPVIAAWLDGRGAAAAAEGGGAAMVQMARTLCGAADLDDRDGAWIVRSVLGLIALPGADAATERAIVERYVVPPLVLGDVTPGR